MLEIQQVSPVMNATQLVLPILFQLSAFCPVDDHSFPSNQSALLSKGLWQHHHHHKPSPPTPSPTPEHGSYDPTAFYECLPSPSANPLYKGGILKNPTFDDELQGWSPFGGCTLTVHSERGNKYLVASNRKASYQGPSQTLANLTQGLMYAFSAWVRVDGAESALVKATIKANGQFLSAGSIMANRSCWTFLKGGFTSEINASSPTLYFETSDPKVDIWLDTVSLQPFTGEEWNSHQELGVRKSRTRAVTLSVTDCKGKGVKDAEIRVEQISGDFPFGSAIASTILDNPTYQEWFVSRFNTAVFENEMKWYATEPQQGKVSYATADKMLQFCKENGIYVRGHNVFWDDPQYQPGWVKGLSPSELHVAAVSRIQSVMGHYAGQLPQWDVINEMLHFHFFEDKLGGDAAEEIYRLAQEIDPSTTLFLNDFNVIETPQDGQSTPEAYIHRLLELKFAGVEKLGIGLEGHFSGKPNLVYMRAVIDKLATLGLPIWLTEVDINSQNVDPESQAVYLHLVLREAFSHPAVKGIVLWTALHPYGCYRMCLTDNKFKNLPTGDTVDVFLRNIRTVGLRGTTDHEGRFSFQGFHGQYEITVTHNTTSVIKRLAIGPETDMKTVHVLVS